MKPIPVMVFLFLLTSSIAVCAQGLFLGERYDYKLTYLSIPAVNIQMSVPETLTINNKKVFHVLFIARTSSFFSPFYTLENRYHTYVDMESGLPVKYTKDIHQRTLDQHVETLYDQEGNTAIYEGGRFSSQIRMSIQENTHNLFSMILFMRRVNLQVGQKLNFNLDVESERWKVNTEVIGRERVNAADSSFDAYKISFQFSPVKEELERKHTDILTRRVATSQTHLYFWVGAATPYPFLKVEFEMSPFSTYTTLIRR